MSRHPFGWDLPPGVTQRQIDEAAGGYDEEPERDEQGEDQIKSCSCGSGEPRRANYDGHGIFLTFTCSKCHAERMKGFRPDIMAKYEADEPIEEDC